MAFVERSHAVRHHHQLDTASCWWACTAMLMRFRGHPYHRYPWQYDRIFRRVPLESMGSRPTVERFEARDPAEWFERNPGAPDVERADADRLRLPGGYPRRFLHPTYWYRLGVPRDVSHVGLWQRLTPLRWTPLQLQLRNVFPGAAQEAERTERAREWLALLGEEPLLFIHRFEARTHARLLVGCRYDSDDPTSAMVDVQDPARDRRRLPTPLRGLLFTTDYVLRCEPR